MEFQNRLCDGEMKSNILCRRNVTVLTCVCNDEALSFEIGNSGREGIRYNHCQELRYIFVHIDDEHVRCFSLRTAGSSAHDPAVSPECRYADFGTGKIV